MNYLSSFPALAVCVALAACSSDDADFGTLQSNAALVTQQANTLGASNSADIPTSGSAKYAGYLGLNTGTNDVIGELGLNVDFSRDEVKGSATNFISASNITYAGTLDVSGGFIDRTADTTLGDPHILADVDGTLKSDNVESVIDAQLRSTFHGPGRDTLSGYISGTVTNSFNTTALNSANSNIAATRN